MNDLDLLAINLTRQCNLACAHCYLDAGVRSRRTEGELTKTEVCTLLDDVAARSTETMVVLTGGEPLLRTDVEDIVAHGAGRGLSMVLGTNGTALTPDRASTLKEAGLLGAGISIDSLNPASHDAFRGKDGCFARACAALDTCRDHGLATQIHFSVTCENLEEVPDVIGFARSRGARVVNYFFLVCTGRGETMTDISAAQYERVLRQIVTAQADNEDLIIRPRCAPHFKRIAHQLAPDAAVNQLVGSDGCIAGKHYCRVTPNGGVTACPYVPTETGNIRSQPLFELWDNASEFETLRQPELEGKCGICEYRSLCGGCRARAFAEFKNMMAHDPLCTFEPSGRPVLIPLDELPTSAVTWSADAEQRLARIPGFVRKMVKRKVEVYAAQSGETVVTCGHLDALTAKRFGGKPPMRPMDRSTSRN